MPGPDSFPLAATEVLSALKKQKFGVRLDEADWGSWIHLEGLQSTISVDMERRQVYRATLEIHESEEDEVQQRLFSAFAGLDWIGEDDEGPFSLK